MSINVRCAGRFITLTKQIGSGGEGDVYQHPTEPAQVIKLFKESNRRVKAEKVAAMLVNAGEFVEHCAILLVLVLDSMRMEYPIWASVRGKTSTR